MQEMVSMGIGSKPFMDIKPSDAAISDRAIDYIMKGTGECSIMDFPPLISAILSPLQSEKRGLERPFVRQSLRACCEHDNLKNKLSILMHAQ